jgi:F0F1-type ATP synthase alpha subunit
LAANAIIEMTVSNLIFAAVGSIFLESDLFTRGWMPFRAPFYGSHNNTSSLQ